MPLIEASGGTTRRHQAIAWPGVRVRAAEHSNTPLQRHAPTRHRWASVRLALFALLFYSSIFLIKASMFACMWSSRPSIGGLGFKTCLALAQTFGYAAGKVPALMITPKLPHERLRGALFAVILAAGTCVTLSCTTSAALSLLLVALACVWLAPAWSLLSRFLEGRRETEAIVARSPDVDEQCAQLRSPAVTARVRCVCVMRAPTCCTSRRFVRVIRERQQRLTTASATGLALVCPIG